MGRKIPFENVLRNLQHGRYNGKIQSAGYSNEGLQLFNERKFADNLGVSEQWLREIGLIKITNQNGWNLPTKPTEKELLEFKEKILERANCKFCGKPAELNGVCRECRTGTVSEKGTDRGSFGRYKVTKVKA